MKIKTILKIIIPIMLFIYIGIIGIPYRYYTLEYNSNIFYRNDIEIYKIFSSNSVTSLNNKFDFVIEKFIRITDEYEMKLFYDRSIVILQSKEEIHDMFINPEKILNNIEKEFFEHNELGILAVSYVNLQWLRKPKIHNIENNLVFTIEIWKRTPSILLFFLPIARTAFNELIFLKIPKQT